MIHPTLLFFLRRIHDPSCPGLVEFRVAALYEWAEEAFLFVQRERERERERERDKIHMWNILPAKGDTEHG